MRAYCSRQFQCIVEDLPSLLSSAVVVVIAHVIGLCISFTGVNCLIILTVRPVLSNHRIEQTCFNSLPKYFQYNFSTGQKFETSPFSNGRVRQEQLNWCIINFACYFYSLFKDKNMFIHPVSKYSFQKQ